MEKFTRSEAEIKAAIVQYLRVRGCLVIPYRTGGINKGTHWIKAPMVGIADLLGLTKEGKFFAVEVKTAIGKTTPEQERFLMSVREHGCVGIVARSIDDVKREGL